MDIPIIIVLLLTISGWLISLYFRLVHLERIQAEVRWMPSFLQMGNCRCDELVETRFGRTLGRSNAYLGLWYFTLFGLATLAHQFYKVPTVEILFLVSLLAFAHSVYLAWGLSVLRVACKPCLGVHIINLAILGVYLTRVWPKLFV